MSLQDAYIKPTRPSSSLGGDSADASEVHHDNRKARRRFISLCTSMFSDRLRDPDMKDA